jgi:hypothetical protein
MYSSGNRAGVARSQPTTVRTRKLAPTIVTSQGAGARFTSFSSAPRPAGLSKRKGAVSRALSELSSSSVTDRRRR